MRLFPLVPAEKEIQIKQLFLHQFNGIDTTFVKANSSPHRKIVVALAADYGNLGDVAITMAQARFLEEKYPEYDVLLFPVSATFMKMKSLQRIVQPQDLITLVGGGNTGDQYPTIEFARQFIIKHFPQNSIISFPQTVDYQNKNKIVADLNKYQRHQHLLLTVREQRSYDFYQHYYQGQVELLPDIVLTLGERYGHSCRSRSSILLCLRQDKEQGVNLAQEDLTALAEKDQLEFQDTQLTVDHLPLAQGMQEVERLINVFQQKQLIITDRLHGMILACITGTPCIALDNKNKKISGVYQAWLKSVRNIQVFETTPTSSELMVKVNELYGQTYEPPKFKTYFEKLVASVS
ncbi:exopolysaccharide pyruvyl transferase [Lapidilactobacillus dextrinicus DSM 20335]|uniref:Exopolysaccharide pyruvyl transferase n=1 Tax=Lapidilactobacillus dextrinicus DSM 20335 TaxID=1423738 RepID=A0A0R2BHL0_9LACO|nr:polysaccharide pyruvyl transferase family protein [Lapidilactobacillus dextrinicus]KRM78496.1 exopolysaccharide pyruvyl transferase [Lapidilactobacillus dextrinicus DSM 20335]QFG46176.1 hypothetical protein LH506_01315 [Lapidilactobacillus dextrinicus]